MEEERSHYRRDSRRASPSRDTDRHRRRSRSPHHKRRRTASPDEESSRHRHRDDRSHRHSHRSHHSSSHRSHRKDDTLATTLPFEARHLTKHDLTVFEPLLAEFLYIQKGKDIGEMEDREVKGRWKSFLGKWNRGELAEGWYDPEMFARIVEREGGAAPPGRRSGGGSGREEVEDEFGRDRRDRRGEGGKKGEEESAGSESEDYGPTLPGEGGSSKKAGVAIPTREDLTLRDEQRGQDHNASIEALRDARKTDRKLQKERLEDLTPRAEPGTRERRLEKKAALNEKLKGFREKSPGGEAEVGDGELMGGGDEMAELKREKVRVERRKTEREVRREEEERIKEEEREERRRVWREREEGTVGRLRELAMARFGSK